MLRRRHPPSARGHRPGPRRPRPRRRRPRPDRRRPPPAASPSRARASSRAVGSHRTTQAPWNQAPCRSRRWASPTTLRPSTVTSPAPTPPKQTSDDHRVHAPGPAPLDLDAGQSEAPSADAPRASEPAERPGDVRGPQRVAHRHPHVDPHRVVRGRRGPPPHRTAAARRRGRAAARGESTVGSAGSSRARPPCRSGGTGPPPASPGRARPTATTRAGRRPGRPAPRSATRPAPVQSGTGAGHRSAASRCRRRRRGHASGALLPPAAPRPAPR